jgi:hypothetical protein
VGLYGRFSALYAAKNSSDPYPYLADISHEHLPELCIHHYVRSHLVPELPELKSCFASTDYEKILIVRDPLSRLVSSILSKYLMPDGFFAYEHRHRLPLFALASVPDELGELLVDVQIERSPAGQAIPPRTVR